MRNLDLSHTGAVLAGVDCASPDRFCAEPIMTAHAAAGQAPSSASLIDVSALQAAYFKNRPDPAVGPHRVAFGTSGHRGCAFDCSFNEAHILAITQALCEYRAANGIEGPLFIGRDTHALSTPAHQTAIEVLTAHGVEVRVAARDDFTPTPVISHAILTWNRGRSRGFADGILMTPSHNPPQDGGFKYNPPHGGPADTEITHWIEQRANALLGDTASIKRFTMQQAVSSGLVVAHDFLAAYVSDLEAAIDFEPIRGGQLRLAVDPLGGAGVNFWPAIAEHYRFSLEILNSRVDPTFAFLRCDWDGQLRMDPSSPPVMQGVVDAAGAFDVAFACDADHDRHGIVTRSAGLLPPNHYLAAAIDYLIRHRPEWSTRAAIGKTLVSSAMIDRVVQSHTRNLYEVPVGFKWFVPGLASGDLAFGGEESAGASFLRRDGQPWTTDKDGMLLNLLAAEMTARTGQDPALLYAALTRQHGAPVYARIDAPATLAQKARLKRLSPADIQAQCLAGDPVLGVLTRAPGNHAEIGGIKVETRRGWFAARPSGTENVYKIYAESFEGPEHLAMLQSEARELITQTLAE